MQDNLTGTFSKSLLFWSIKQTPFHLFLYSFSISNKRQWREQTKQQHTVTHGIQKQQHTALQHQHTVYKNNTLNCSINTRYTKTTTHWTAASTHGIQKQQHTVLQHQHMVYKNNTLQCSINTRCTKTTHWTAALTHGIQKQQHTVLQHQHTVYQNNNNKARTIDKHITDLFQSISTGWINASGDNYVQYIKVYLNTQMEICS